METVNWNTNGGVLPGSSITSPMVINLPTYEGITHFWADSIGPFKVKTNNIFNGRRSQSWLDQLGIYIP
jgi:hypothetical protein